MGNVTGASLCCVCHRNDDDDCSVHDDQQPPQDIVSDVIQAARDSMRRQPQLCNPAISPPATSSKGQGRSKWPSSSSSSSQRRLRGAGRRDVADNSSNSKRDQSSTEKSLELKTVERPPQGNGNAGGAAAAGPNLAQGRVVTAKIAIAMEIIGSEKIAPASQPFGARLSTDTEAQW